MLNAATEQFGRNPFSGLVDGTSAANPQQGTENRDPLPNPWSAGGGQPAPDSTNPTPQPRPSALNNPSMSSLLQQMSENPQLVQNMLSAPYTQSMIQALAADPNMANAIINHNPYLQENSAIPQQMRSIMPQLFQQMQNPELQNIMGNPQALNALLQIQQGMETLRQTAPNVMNTLGISQPGFLPTAPTTTGTDSTTTTNTSTTTTTTPPTTTPGPAGDATAAQPRLQTNDSFSEVRLSTKLF